MLLRGELNCGQRRFVSREEQIGETSGRRQCYGVGSLRSDVVHDVLEVSMDIQVHGMCGSRPGRWSIVDVGGRRRVVNMAHIASGTVRCFVGVVGWRHQTNGFGCSIICET